MRIYGSGLCLAAFLLLVSGCGEPSASSKATDGSAPTSSVVTDAAQPELQPPADESLTLNQYAEAGVPNADGPWSSEDITKAASSLLAIAQKDINHLPRYQSEGSGKVFERLTSDASLDFYRDRSQPLEQRFPDVLNYLQSFSLLSKTYWLAFRQKAVGDSEFIETYDAQLRLSVVTLDLVDEFLSTLDKNDTRIANLQQMKGGMVGIISNGLQILTESNFYRTSELKRFAGYMEKTLPLILPKLPEDNQAELLAQLRSFSDDPKMQPLKPELDSLVAAAEKSIN